MDLQELSDWMRTFAIQYGYLGIFLISLFGSVSIIFPIPSSVVIFTLGGLDIFDPFFIAVAAGLGSTVGEFSGYLLGYGGRRFIGDRYRKKMDTLTRLFKRYGSVVIFIFALTPLPDDLLFIPLGVLRYSIIRSFVPALIGKFLSNLIIAYSGRLSINLIRDLFGVEGEGVSLLIGIVVALVLLVIILLIMFKVNWEKVVEKHLNERDRQDSKTAAEKPDQNEQTEKESFPEPEDNG